MKKKPDVTAEQFLSQLASDPDYQAKVQDRYEQAARIREEEGSLLRELDRMGFPAESLSELRRRYVPMPPEVSGKLLDRLKSTSLPALQEAIVRCLAYPDAGYDIGNLTALFERTNSDSLRWVIANTLAELRPLGARDWVVDAFTRRHYGRTREMLALAIARIVPAERANAVLTRCFDEMPGHVAIALGESGGVAELKFLKDQLNAHRGWQKKEIERSIRAIRKRIGV